VHETGHRIGSVRRLRWSAIDIDRRMTPWRAENDKIGFAYETPLSDAAVALFGAAKNRREIPAECTTEILLRVGWNDARTLEITTAGTTVDWKPSVDVPGVGIVHVERGLGFMNHNSKRA
jgi:integrase